MDADNIVRWAEFTQSRQQKTDLDAALAELRHDIAAWCETRPEASGLTIAAVYDELVRLDAKERSLLRNQKRACFDPDDDPIPRALELWKAQEAEIVRALDSRRQLLRSRALALSRDRLRPLKVTDLPPELLHIIFRYLQAPPKTRPPFYHTTAGQYCERAQDGSGGQAVRNARLVCRLFSSLATPLMFPILCLQLSQSSLDLVSNISNNPTMAAGVHAVRLSLAYRPREHADNISHYMHARLSDLDRHKRDVQIELSLQPNAFARGVGNSEAQPLQSLAGLEQALRNFGALRGQWGMYARNPGRKRWMERPLPKYMRILREGYNEFRRLREEQLRLLQDSSFANTLALAVSRMPNARSLTFLYEEHDETPDAADSASLLTNDEILSQFMARPLRQQTIKNGPETVGDYPEFEAARLLWQVPVALYKKGAALTEILLSELPLYGNYSMLCPQGQTSWHDLGAACSNLEVFTCENARHWAGANEPLQGEDKIHFDNYVGTILSQCGQRLRVLELDYGVPSRGTDTADPVVSRLSAMPRIRRLGLRNMELQRQTFHALCSGLGNGLESLSLTHVELIPDDRGWERSVDILRNKMAVATKAARPLGGCNLKMLAVYGLSGGEFSDLKPIFTEMGQLHPRAAARHIVTEIKDYIYGTRETNPFSD